MSNLVDLLLSKLSGKKPVLEEVKIRKEQGGKPSESFADYLKGSGGQKEVQKKEIGNSQELKKGDVLTASVKDVRHNVRSKSEPSHKNGAIFRPVSCVRGSNVRISKPESEKGRVVDVKKFVESVTSKAETKSLINTKEAVKASVSLGIDSMSKSKPHEKAVSVNDKHREVGESEKRTLPKEVQVKASHPFTRNEVQKQANGLDRIREKAVQVSEKSLSDKKTETIFSKVELKRDDAISRTDQKQNSLPIQSAKTEKRVGKDNGGTEGGALRKAEGKENRQVLDLAQLGRIAKIKKFFQKDQPKKPELNVNELRHGKEKIVSKNKETTAKTDFTKNCSSAVTESGQKADKSISSGMQSRSFDAKDNRGQEVGRLVVERKEKKESIRKYVAASEANKSSEKGSLTEYKTKKVVESHAELRKAKTEKPLFDSRSDSRKGEEIKVSSIIKGFSEVKFSGNTTDRVEPLGGEIKGSSQKTRTLTDVPSMSVREKIKQLAPQGQKVTSVKTGQESSQQVLGKKERLEAVTHPVPKESVRKASDLVKNSDKNGTKVDRNTKNIKTVSNIDSIEKRREDPQVINSQRENKSASVYKEERTEKGSRTGLSSDEKVSRVNESTISLGREVKGIDLAIEEHVLPLVAVSETNFEVAKERVSEVTSERSKKGILKNEERQVKTGQEVSKDRFSTIGARERAPARDINRQEVDFKAVERQSIDTRDAEEKEISHESATYKSGVAPVMSKKIGMDVAIKSMSMNALDVTEKRTLSSLETSGRSFSAFTDREQSQEQGKGDDSAHARKFLANNAERAKASSTAKYEDIQQVGDSGKSVVSNALSRANLDITSLATQAEVAPLVMKEIEKIRESGKSWSRVSVKLADGSEASIHLKLKGENLMVRVGRGSESIHQALVESWEGLSRNAKDVGIVLGNLEFLDEQSGERTL